MKAIWKVRVWITVKLGRSTLGDGKSTIKTAVILTTFIEHKIKDEVENKIQVLATKDDLAKVERKIDESKVDMIKWMLAIWVTIVLMFIGLYFKN